jgi:hypothetical protein
LRAPVVSKPESAKADRAVNGLLPGKAAAAAAAAAQLTICKETFAAEWMLLRGSLEFLKVVRFPINGATVKSPRSNQECGDVVDDFSVKLFSGGAADPDFDC